MLKKTHRYLDKDDNMAGSDKRILYSIVHYAYDVIRYAQYYFLYLLFRPIPLKNKIVASSFNGNKYGDNTRYILEAVHELDETVELVWLCNPEADFDLPEYVKRVKCSDKRGIAKRLFHYYTSKVWVDTHLYDKYLKKRSGQFVVETWHGGLGIKKIEGDVPKFRNNRFQVGKIQKTCQLADLFISNSDFLSGIYRRAFGYNGEIWKTGFPKNDIVLSKNNEYRKELVKQLGVSQNVKFIIYAPTYRGKLEDTGCLDMTPYDLDFSGLINAFQESFGGEWMVLVRWHPWMKQYIDKTEKTYPEGVVDATGFFDMPEIISCADAFITDYSSCIFDAALKRIPCFIYANDFDEYIGDRGVYYTLEQLPFPCADNNESLAQLIRDYQPIIYIQRLSDFEELNGLFEPGDAANVIAKKIINTIQ